MPHAQDDNAVRLHSIAQDVGPHRHHLPPALAGIAAALGGFGEAVGGFDQALAQAPRCAGIECLDIFDDRFEMGDGFFRPDDGPHKSALGARPRQAGAAAPRSEPAAHRRMAHHSPRGGIRVSARVGRSLGGGIVAVEKGGFAAHGAKIIRGAHTIHPCAAISTASDPFRPGPLSRAGEGYEGLASCCLAVVG